MVVIDIDSLYHVTRKKANIKLKIFSEHFYFELLALFQDLSLKIWFLMGFTTHFTVECKIIASR